MQEQSPSPRPNQRTALERLVRVTAVLLALAWITAACSSDDDDSDPTTTTSEAKSVSDASSDDLEAWQKDLNAVGCWAGPVDGELGPETEAAIKEYQEAKGLTVDGLLGPETEAALEKDAEEGNTVCTGGGSSTTSTTGGGGDQSACPGGPECYQTSISPTSGGYGTVITVTIVEGGCGDEASLEPPGGGEPIASTGQMDPAAGSLNGTMTVPDEIPAPETYTVSTNAGPQSECAKSFEVTAG